MSDRPGRPGQGGGATAAKAARSGGPLGALFVILLLALVTRSVRLALVLAVAWLVVHGLKAVLRRPPPTDASVGHPAGVKAERPPHAVLGVPAGASEDEVTQAYRELIKRYHPDRVVGMPEEFQRLAHDRTIEIRAAYESLRPAAASRPDAGGRPR